MTEIGTACRGKLILGDNILDIRKNTVTRDGVEIPVAAQTLEVARCLARRPGELVTRDELIQDLWDGNFPVGSKRVTDEVWRLRRALGDNPTHPKFIKTVPRRGYQLVVTPHWIDDAEAESPHVKGGSPQVTGQGGARAKVLSVVAVVSVVGLLLALLHQAQHVGGLEARVAKQEQLLDRAVGFFREALSDTLADEGVELSELLQKSASMIPAYAGEPALQSRLTLSLAQIHVQRGELGTAESLARLASSQASAAGEPELRASIMLTLADVLWLRGNIDEAESVFAEIARGNQAAGDSARATALTGLGIVSWMRGDLDTAEAHYRQALSLRHKLYGRMHADVASGMGNLAIVLKDQKRYAEAEGLYQDALSIRQLLFGDNDPDVARSHNNYGELLMDKGDFEQAAAQYQLAIDIQRSSVGERHYGTGSMMLNLARAYLKLGRAGEASSLYQSGINIINEALGPDHLHAGYGHRTGAQLLYLQGEHEKAIELAQRAAEILANSLPQDHPDVIEAKTYAEQLVAASSEYNQQAGIN